jgi:predicted nucleic acid-binding protein
MSWPTTRFTLRGHELVLLSQCENEFWAVATRPVVHNGLGMTTAQADAELTAIESQFRLLPDHPAVHPAWRRLVVAYGVSGKPTHDARLLAAMLVHGVDALLTFNDTHFRRFQPAIQVFSPAAVVASPP